MSLIIVGRSMKRVDPFCPSVDVVPNYMLIIVGYMSQSFDHFACIHKFSVCNLILFV